MQNLLLTDKDMAEIFSVNAGTIRTWVNRKTIPTEAIFKMPGKRGAVRFIKSKVEDWINGNLQTQQ